MHDDDDDDNDNNTSTTTAYRALPPPAHIPGVANRPADFDPDAHNTDHVSPSNMPAHLSEPIALHSPSEFDVCFLFK